MVLVWQIADALPNSPPNFLPAKHSCYTVCIQLVTYVGLVCLCNSGLCDSLFSWPSVHMYVAYHFNKMLPNQLGKSALLTFVLFREISIQNVPAHCT